uniref:Uncharacterized protein n=1 Tax=Rhizophora mucronata TaxID=61149 RepID=A0A2P2QXE3_RHIMU
MLGGDTNSDMAIKNKYSYMCTLFH